MFLACPITECIETLEKIQNDTLHLTLEEVIAMQKKCEQCAKISHNKTAIAVNNELSYYYAVEFVSECLVKLRNNK